MPFFVGIDEFGGRVDKGQIVAYDTVCKTAPDTLHCTGSAKYAGITNILQENRKFYFNNNKPLVLGQEMWKIRFSKGIWCVMSIKAQYKFLITTSD